MKKFAALAGSAVMLLSMASTTFAFFPFFGSDDVSIRNYGRVTNDVETRADSGDNSIGGMFVGGGRITTGNALATSSVLNDVNSTVLGCGCLDGDLTIHNYGRVYNDVDTKADTGDNSIHGFVVHGGSIRTGGASAGSLVQNSVNFTMVGTEE
jgi:hypothetical protein